MNSLYLYISLNTIQPHSQSLFCSSIKPAKVASISISRRFNRPIYMDILLPPIYSTYIVVRPDGNSARLLMSL